MAKKIVYTECLGHFEFTKFMSGKCSHCGNKYVVQSGHPIECDKCQRPSSFHLADKTTIKGRCTIHGKTDIRKDPGPECQGCYYVYGMHKNNG